MIKKIIFISQLIRLKNIAIAVLCIFLSAHLLSNHNPLMMTFAIIIIISSMSFGNILNDIMDYENDKINHPERILPSHQITLQTATYLAGLCCFITVIVAFYIPYVAQMSLIVIYISLFAYNFYLKKIALIGNIIIAFLLSAVFIFTEMVIMSTYTHLVIPAILSFGTSLIREIVKDLEDLEGDKKTQRKTLPIYLGINNSISFIAILVIFFNIFCLYLYFIYYHSILYLISIIILVEIPLLFSLFLLISNPQKTTFSRVANNIKYITIGGLLILLFANIG